MNPQSVDNQAQNTAVVEPIKALAVSQPVPSPTPVSPVIKRNLNQGDVNVDDRTFEQQFDLERQHQREIKEEKSKLEQLNLQLEQEKAIADINKLKKENAGSYNEPTSDGQNNLPEIRVDYIGGDSTRKEAIVDMAGTSYQVKDKSNMTDDVQVVSISDSSVTLHFNEPNNVTKTFDYKPD